MTLNEYQKAVLAFRMRTATPTYALHGLAGEVGEVASLAAKQVRDGGPSHIYRDSMKKELGDVLWFIAAIADDNGFRLDEIAQGNFEKLQSRSQRGVISGSGDNR